MSTLAIASILEELRCMDGELFKAEICQRLFLWLKTQANESLESAYTKTPAEYAKVLEMYRSWPLEVSREELLTLQEKAGGAEELQSAWVAVSLHWVRLHKKADGNASGGKTSVKIKTPDPRDVLKNFFVSLCSKSWCVRGDLWSMDPVKQDFVFREVFRQSVGNSVHFLQEVTESSREDFSSSSTRKEEEGKSSVRQEVKSVARDEEKQKNKPEEDIANKQKSFELNKHKLEQESLLKDSLQREEPEFTEKEEATTTTFQSTDNKTHTDPRSNAGVKESESSFRHEEEQTKEHEDEDDIGPDDSVSQFFSGQPPKESKFLPTFSSPTPPAKRYADAGTVMYSSAPRRVLVKPITLNLENPIQKSLEE